MPLMDGAALVPDYGRHDTVYRALRARGASGWGTPQEDAILLGQVLSCLPAPPARILELGSGAGNLTWALARLGYDVDGVDISPTAVGWARERAPAESPIGKAEFRIDNVVALQTCVGSSLDVVVDGHCLHCIVGDDRARCLAAVRRVLKPGGRFVALTMCGQILDERMRAAFDPGKQWLVAQGRPVRHIGSAPSICAEIVAAGFAIDSVRIDPRANPGELDDLVVCAVSTSMNPAAGD